jgi:hypothetical protein
MSQRSHAITCNVAEIACNCMQFAAIACNCMQCHAISKKAFLSLTVRVLENTPGTRSETESLPEEFLHDNCEQIYYHYFFDFLKKEEMRSGTHFTQQTCFFLPRQVPRKKATTPRVANPVDKPTLRVANPVDTPTLRVEATTPQERAKEMSPERAKMQLIHATTSSRARIPQRHQMNLHQSQCSKGALSATRKQESS